MAMHPLKNLLNFKKTLPSQSGPFVFSSQAGGGFFAQADYSTLARLGYEQNVIVYRCVNLIARSLAAVPLRVFVKNKRMDIHPVLNLLQKPNPMQSCQSFMEMVVSFLLLSGNAYIEGIITSDNQQPTELYALRPDRLSVVPGERGLPAAYVYRVQNKKRTIPVDRFTGHSRLLHLKFFHPANDWYGLSPLEAAKQSIHSHSTVAKHNLSLLQNGGRPSGALFLKEPGRRLNTEQREELRKSLSEIYKGSENAGQMMVLEGDVDWKEMGLSPKDMDFNQGKSMATREIAQAFGVPPMLVGVPGDATFSNYKEARLHLWEDTILPLLDRLVGQLNTWLMPAFAVKEDVRLSYDPDAIPSIAMKRESAWERLNGCTFLTPNEKRASLGYAPIQGGDTLPLQSVRESAEGNQ